MKCLLDTNIVSLAMSADAEVLRQLARTAPGQSAISAVTHAEIRFGLARLRELRAPAALQRKQELYDRLLDYLDVLPWDVDAADAYAAERVACEAEGESLDQADLMILSHAAASGRVLVTRDAALLRRHRRGAGKLHVVAW
jgi:tRNA(fMet)-specific endonuclease VapC